MQHRDQFLRRLRQQLRGLDRLPLQIQEAGLDLRRARGGLGDIEHAGRRKRRAGKEIQHPDPLDALAHDMMAIIGASQIAYDIGDGADTIEIVRARFVQLGVTLQQDADLTLFAHRLLRGGDRLRTPQRDRGHHAGKQDGVAHGH